MDERRIKDELEKASREHKVLEENIRKTTYDLQGLTSKRREAEGYVREAQLKLQKEQQYHDGVNNECVALENRLKDYKSREEDYRRKVDEFKREFEQIQRELERKR